MVLLKLKPRSRRTFYKPQQLPIRFAQLVQPQGLSHLLLEHHPIVALLNFKDLLQLCKQPYPRQQETLWATLKSILLHAAAHAKNPDANQLAVVRSLRSPTASPESSTITDRSASQSTRLASPRHQETLTPWSLLTLPAPK